MGNVQIYDGSDKDPQRCGAGVFRKVTTMRSRFEQCRAKKLEGYGFCGTHKRADEYEPPKRYTVYSARALLYDITRAIDLPEDLGARVQDELNRKPTY